jgi:hypothetical protein
MSQASLRAFWRRVLVAAVLGGGMMPLVNGRPSMAQNAQATLMSHVVDPSGIVVANATATVALPTWR